MGLLLRNQEQRTRLQTKVAADIEERLTPGRQVQAEVPPPAINENQHKTRMAGVVIAALLVVLVVAVVLSVSRL